VLEVVEKIFKYGDVVVSLKTGWMARQADGAVVVDINGTTVLVTAVAAKQAVEGRDFLPLTVDYRMRSYAARRIPGGYFKREGRPTEREILTSRLIDRFIRPLFPDTFHNEIQIIATVLSVNEEIDPDIAAMIGASAVVALAQLPCDGPTGAARVGYLNGEYLLNPTTTQLASSELDLIVAGTDKAVLMVESEAKELSEEVMLGAVLFGQQQLQTVVQAINEFVTMAKLGPSQLNWQPSLVDSTLETQIKSFSESLFSDAYKIAAKVERVKVLASIRDQICKKFVTPEMKPTELQSIQHIIDNVEKVIVRERILNEGTRIDGRDTKTVRPIEVQVGVLPRTHASALFTRGETQALVVATVGTDRDAQLTEGEARESFMLHYNFPPYSVGEVGSIMGPKRREIGHGNLAKRGLSAVMPSQEDFPYVVRVVSEITESNGSSSMATVCGTSLALMDGGIPIKAPVAGIAMGLIKENDRFAILTDILGDEDHLGDMDFKVAGTASGITALQMDIKINGITAEIMDQALVQAKEGRLHILGIMNQTIHTHRGEMSEYAPRIITMRISPDKIRDVIGKGGATIRAITEETGAVIDISDEGLVKIAVVDSVAGEEAYAWIQRIVAEVEIGMIYEGRVAKIMDFGAFVSILPGKDGLVHISQISNERVNSVSDKLQEGQVVKVKVLEIDKQGRIRLSMKEIDSAETNEA
jgi:polyribonucleotide nucleotidyltransferase